MRAPGRPDPPTLQPEDRHSLTFYACTDTIAAMGYRDTAIEALDVTRAVLRSVLAEMVAADAFSEVAAIARAAESLAAITEELRDSATADHTSPGDTWTKGRPSVSLPVARREVTRPIKSATTIVPTLSQNENFPQYFRVGDRLVKRAWSKKERQPYEHKAPREIIDVLMETIRKRKGTQRPFEAADLMPLHSSSGDEYPSYQSYLGLGWLRHTGAIAKGREGYLLRRGWDGSRITEAWEALPSIA